MKPLLLVAAILLPLPTLAAEKHDEAEKQALAAAESWLALVDDGKYSESWDAAADYLKNAVTKDAFVTTRPITLKTGELVAIRSAQPDDAAQLIAYVRSVLAESPQVLLEPDEFNFTEEQERQWLQDHLDGPGKCVVVAEVSGTVIGCLSFENGSHRRIFHRGSLGVSVRRQWRGRGIGTALLQSLLDWAEANPLIEKIGLSVFANNVDAIRLYKRLGFVEDGRQSREMKLGPGDHADNILMCRFV
jgi:RimJ/RimL family protein N-acetyltransferase